MIGGHNEWDLEAWFYVNRRGIDREEARIFVILRWMWHGDFRPLAAAIWEGGEGAVLHDVILCQLAKFIDEGRLKLVHNRKHRPKDPGTGIKRIMSALVYETSDQPSSSERVRLGRRGARHE